MEHYRISKVFDLVSSKNVEEDEERNEIVNTVYFDSSHASIKNIHNKRKDFR